MFMRNLWLRGYSLFLRTRFLECGENFRADYPLKVYNPRRMRIGRGVVVGAHVWLNGIEGKQPGATLSIGDGTSIGRFCHINAYREVVIEEKVLIAERVFISDGSHHFDQAEIPIIDQGESFKAPVCISRGAWIGSGAVILPGVTVGRNAVIGANAVVTQDVPDHFVATGIPAQIRPKQEAAAQAWRNL